MARSAPVRSRRQPKLDRHLMRLVDAGSLEMKPGLSPIVDELVAADLARHDPASGRIVPTEEGVSRARRSGARAAGLQDHAFLAQHARLRRGSLPDEPGGRQVILDDTESPLAWLRRRTDKAGRPLLDAAEYAAGERFRADLERAGVRPRVTAHWAAGPRRAAGAPGGVEETTIMSLAARQRIDAALDALGPDFAGLLIDVCGFLKGLETVEAERGWPARSAKVVLVLALRRLAQHYGLLGEARGPDRSLGIRLWRDTSAPVAAAGP